MGCMWMMRPRRTEFVLQIIIVRTRGPRNRVLMAEILWQAAQMSINAQEVQFRIIIFLYSCSFQIYVNSKRNLG